MGQGRQAAGLEIRVIAKWYQCLAGVVIQPPRDWRGARSWPVVIHTASPRRAGETVRWDKAVLSIGIPDLRGLKEMATQQFK